MFNQYKLWPILIKIDLIKKLKIVEKEFIPLNFIPAHIFFLSILVKVLDIYSHLFLIYIQLNFNRF
jgi:hypothetical protein